jgi:transcriptional regulator with XRE-family HTH domain
MPAAKKPKKPTNRRAKADKNDVLALATGKPLTQEQIGKLVGLSQNRVSEILQDVKSNDAFKQFQSSKAEVLENLQYKLINLADDDLLKTMLSKRGFTDAAILQDKIQVLRGQASEVTGVQIRVILDNLPAPAIDVTPQDVNAITADNTTSSVLDICNIDNIRSIRDK